MHICGMSNLVGLSTYCGGPNAGGLLKIEYVPVSWVVSLTYDELISSAGNWQKAITFATGDWLEAHVLPMKRMWGERMRRSAGANYYEQLIDLIVPNLKPEVTKEFEAMAEYRFLVKLQDAEGKPWLIGTKDAPLEFLEQGTTGETGQLKHYKINFSANTPKPGRGYVPVF